METVHSEVGDDEPSRLKVMDKQLNVSSRIIAQDYDTDEMNIQHEYDLVKEEELETKHRYKEKRDKKEKKDKKDKKERKRLKKERKRKEK